MLDPLSDSKPETIRLIRRASFGWLVFFVIYNIYSVFWRYYIGGHQYDFLDSQLYWLKDWSVWLILTPITYLILNHKDQEGKNTSWCILLFFANLIITTCIRILLDFEEFSNDLAFSVVALVPRYTIAGMVVLVYWYYDCLKNSQAELIRNADQITGNKPTFEETDLSVEHLGITKRIAFDELFWLNSSGNYVELHTHEQTYLQRITMKGLLKTLPADTFKQIHRSHVVNLSKVVKLSNGENGALIVTLSNQQKLTVSKNYKSNLKKSLAQKT